MIVQFCQTVSGPNSVRNDKTIKIVNAVDLSHLAMLIGVKVAARAAMCWMVMGTDVLRKRPVPLACCFASAAAAILCQSTHFWHRKPKHIKFNYCL